jgi:phosphinothricin acetyltransferase
MNIRKASVEDQNSILEIYNEAVLNTTATFDTEPRTIEKQLEWFAKHKKNHPVIVLQ